MATMKVKCFGQTLKLKIYDEKNYKELISAGPEVESGTKGYGLIRRDLTKDPVGSRRYAPEVGISPLPRDQWKDRIQEQDKNETSLMHVRMKADHGSPMKSLDQNGQGYCWAYSTTAANMLIRALMNLPFHRLSAHKVGCLVKGYRNQGGWCQQSLDHITRLGVPTVEHWQEKSMSRSNDTPAMRENALLHRIAEWDDMPEGGSKATRFGLQTTLLLLNRPVILDLNWWSHSVCAIKAVLIGASAFGTLILNSWTDNWENMGMAVLAESKAAYDGSCSPRAVLPSAA